ncbi:DNA polymerase [Actinocrispum wychmicini]|nr:DNA polymerase [Actinocrispum wychmicini]
MRFLGPREPDWRLHLISRKQFVERWMWDIGYKRNAIIAGFNLPFDFSRIALSVTDARPPFTDGFSFQLWDYTLRPNLRIKHLDSKKSFIGWTYTTIADTPNTRGRFIDLRTATFALTNVPHTLDSAADVFGCSRKTHPDTHGVITSDYVDYCRNDVNVTTELLARVTEEYERHPIPIPLHRVFSPATLSKGYYRSMGLVPPLEKYGIDDSTYGRVMSAFYGARTECRIRGARVPVTLVDFTSMYPTVNALMGMWDLLKARDVNIVEATDSIRELIDTHHLDDYFTNRNLWHQFVGIARIRPDGDVLPVRAQYGDGSTYNIGVNHLTYDGDLWYAIPDLVASKLLTGRTPNILEAIRFVPVGQQDELKKVALRGDTVIDPMGSDFFKWVIEQRARVRDTKPALAEFLKVLANSGSYGVFAEMVRDDALTETTVEMFSAPDTPWRARVRHPERPGQYAWPPVAASITAAARLMLAMLEKCVLDAGGSWVFCDTDSMAICRRTDDDPEFPALTDARIDDIIERFDTLSPYDRSLIPHVLKKEYVGYCYAISSKRYALFDENGKVEKYSEHGLGHLKGPHAEWKRDIWSHVIGTYEGSSEWLDTPALSQWSVSTPRLYRTLNVWNQGKNYPDQIKPFNFVSAVYMRPQHKPRLRQGIRGIQLITGYLGGTSPLNAEWINKYDPNGPRYTITGGNIEDDMWGNAPDVVKVVTYREVLADYSIHPEAKFADAHGEPCGPYTRGRLYRLHVRLGGIDFIGKESNKVDDVQAGLIDAADLQMIATPGDIKWDQMRDAIFLVLSRYTTTENARLAGISRTEYHRLQSGKTRPHPQTRNALVTMAVHIACEDLKRSPRLVKDPRTVLAEWKYTCGNAATNAK